MLPRASRFSSCTKRITQKFKVGPPLKDSLSLSSFSLYLSFVSLNCLVLHFSGLSHSKTNISVLFSFAERTFEIWKKKKKIEGKNMKESHKNLFSSSSSTLRIWSVLETQSLKLILLYYYSSILAVFTALDGRLLRFLGGFIFICC